MAIRFGHGVMTVTIGGEEVPLYANVRAARAICQEYGGLTEAFTQANGFHFDALVNIVNAAAGRSGKAAEATAEAVFAEGVIAVGPLVTTYLGFLGSGGKAPQAADAVAEAEPSGEAD